MNHSVEVEVEERILLKYTLEVEADTPEDARAEALARVQRQETDEPDEVTLGRNFNTATVRVDDQLVLEDESRIWQPHWNETQHEGVLESLREGTLASIADEKHGGIIAYALAPFADRVTLALARLPEELE